jgi:hypothetical protein
MENILSQNKRIKAHLLSGKSLTSLDALYQFGCFRLSARIYDLRDEGMHIQAETVEITSKSVYNGKKRVTKYSLRK